MYGFVSSVLAEKGRHVYTIERSATVADAVRQMNEKGIGALLVVESGRPVGIFTERDVLRRVVDAGRDPASTHVAEVMTREPVTISPDWHVEEAMELMTSHRFRHLPVIEDGNLVGMISIGDLMRWVTIHQEDHIRQMTDYITGRIA
ncbi:MAG: inosine-5-monophosphate dehydrogenase [Tepidiforma sp.]|nr:MAG: inosine-5-monophosphate dehydrogenase [Tepidiforma sp.]